MGIFSDAVTDDAFYSFADVDIFGEPATITVTSTGAQYAVNVVVFRNPDSPVLGAGKPLSPSPSLQVFVPYSQDPTRGMSAPLVESSDTITLADQSAGAITSTAHVVVKILSQDPGGWLYQVR